MTVTLEGGKRYTPKPADPVHCEIHDVTVRWDKLDPIQQLAVEEGLDTVDTLPCILLQSRKYK